jgi:hypothetical protein
MGVSLESFPVVLTENIIAGEQANNKTARMFKGLIARKNGPRCQEPICLGGHEFVGNSLLA